MAYYTPSKVPLNSADEYFNLGDFDRKVSTESRDAQIWFNRGLIWVYAFNHEEAVRCFEQAISHDPNLAMGYWGIAYASGPNWNKAWGSFDQADLKASWHKCHHASRQAEQAATTATDVEKALIEALQHRFPVESPPEDLAAPNLAYANVMREVYKRYRNDLDVVTLFADAVMITSNKKLYDTNTGEPIVTSPVFEIREVLENGMKLPGAMKHPGILHLYIHLMERSSVPHVALVPADHLRDLIPDGGHISHMPSHIDVLVGEYRRSVDSNMKATIADDKFLKLRGAKNFYSFYRFHNYHSLIYAAMLAGQSKVALDATSRMEATISDELLKVKSPPMADWMEFFKAVRVHVLIRFGMWDELKQLELPHDQELYCVTTVMTHYGKGIAWAATGKITEAEKERTLFQAAAKRVPPTRLDYPNKISDILKIASAMLDGELEYRRQNYDVAFKKLREAVTYDDSLLYTEPWGWMLPTRHAYGALSLEQGHVEQAAQAYAEDLGLYSTLTRAHQHPNNVWALHGYHECLKRLGRDAEAQIIQQQLTLAEAVADVPIASSCFCRLDSQSEESRSCCAKAS